DRAAAKAERAPRRWRDAREDGGAPREREPEDVPEVVPGVRHEGERAREKAVDDLDDDERKIEPDPGDERAAVARPTPGIVVMGVRVPIGRHSDAGLIFALRPTEAACTV